MVIISSKICISRPEQFGDATTAGDKMQESIPDDMLPPSDSESDASDTDDVGQICNPNRQEQLQEVDNTDDSSDSSDDSDSERK